MKKFSKNNPIQRDQLKMTALDQLVPGNHPVRKIETAIDFSFIYDLVEELYSEVGRPFFVVCLLGNMRKGLGRIG